MADKRKTYSPDDRLLCEDEYVKESLTHEEIAEKHNVSLSVVKKWSGQYGWKKKQTDYQKMNASANSMLTAIYLAVLKDANETKNADKIYLALKLKKELEARPDPRAIMLEFAEKLIEYCLNNGEEATAEKLADIMPGFAKFAL